MCRASFDIKCLNKKVKYVHLLSFHGIFSWPGHGHFFLGDLGKLGSGKSLEKLNLLAGDMRFTFLLCFNGLHHHHHL